MDPADADYAIFKLQMPRNTWFGIGLGTSNMREGSDLIQIDGGALKAFDMNSLGKRAPAKD